MSQRISRAWPMLLLAIALVATALWLQREPATTADGSSPAIVDGNAREIARERLPPSNPAPSGSTSTAWPAFLPAEARPVLQRIASGGPHPYRQDGSVFQNREGHLPQQARGYYREYTVDTPGLNHRGARRIVTGGRPPAVYYYTDDHYDSFRRFDPPRGSPP